MPEIINLRQARKQKTRAQKAEKAAENRVKFGLSKQEKNKISAEKSKIIKELDHKKLED